MRVALPLAGLLFVVALAAAADLQCYVCDDCETEFKNTAKTCEAGSGGGETGGGETGGGNTGGGETGGGETGGGNTGGGNTGGGETGGGNTGGGETGGGNTGGGETGGGNTGGGETGGGNTGGGETGGGNTGGGNTGGGETGGGNTGGGNTGGGETGGGNTGGGNTGGGNTGGGETEGGGGESSQSNFGDTSLGKSNPNEAPRAVHINKRSIQMDESSAKATRAALLRFVRQAGARASEVRCVTASFEENGKTKVKRGCSLSGATDAERCKALVGSTSQQVKDCKVCEGNLCNAAPKLAVAIVPIIISLFIHF